GATICSSSSALNTGAAGACWASTGHGTATIPASRHATSPRAHVSVAVTCRLCVMAGLPPSALDHTGLRLRPPESVPGPPNNRLSCEGEKYDLGPTSSAPSPRRRFGHGGQDDVKGGATLGAVLHPEPALVGGHDRMAHREPHAHPARLGGHEGLE